MKRTINEIESLLIEAGKKFKNLQFMADYLDISYQVLTYWIEVYLGIRKEDFFRKCICKRNCKLLKMKEGYRYIVDKKIEKEVNCRCRIGHDNLIVSIEDQDLKEFCLKNGFEINEIVLNDEYEIKVK